MNTFNYMNTFDFDKKNLVSESQPCVIAIGNFDGFHIGHQKIVDTLKTIASEKGLLSVILTFTPNPKVFFNPGFHTINTDAQKKRILEAQGTDRVVFLDFKEVVNMSDECFLKQCLIEKFNMKHIVMGENFRFGKSRTGDISVLKNESSHYDFGLSVVKPVAFHDSRISSTLIRSLLADAKIEISNRMLGRKYFIEGVVVEGEKVGRRLGFPTINVKTENTLIPEGVFKTSVEIAGEHHEHDSEQIHYQSVTSIGCRPTFNGKEKKIETHILDFNRDLYGKYVRIYFDRKLRNEIKFDSETSLVKQIKQDIENLKVDKV